MAIKPFTPSAPISATPTPKKKGSGFVSFDKAAEQNRQASYALGDKIQSNLGQQVQAVQGQVQNEQQAVQSQLGAEQARLGQVGSVAQGIQANPIGVDKSQYKDLTSGTAKQADTKGIQQLQGSLGSTAQVAQQFSANPFARQQAIQDTVKRPVAMQNLMGVQRNLDSMLLGRNVNTQDLATKTAREAFNVDRLVGSTVKQAGETGQALQTQAQDARNMLRTSRQTAVGSLNKAGEDQALTFNTGQNQLSDYLNTGKFFEDLASTEAASDPAKMQQAIDVLKAGGLDLNSELDLTDLGKEGFEGLVKASFQKGQIDKQEALNDDQRAKLKVLYGLEDETQDFLNKKYDPVGSKFTGATSLLDQAEKSTELTNQYSKNFDDVVKSLQQTMGDTQRDSWTAQMLGTDLAGLRDPSGKAIRDALIRGGKDFGYYDKVVDELFELQHTGGWGAARGKALEDVQRFAQRTPTKFSDIYKRNLKG